MKEIIKLLFLASVIFLISCGRQNSNVKTEEIQKTNADSIVITYNDEKSLDSLSKLFVNKKDWYGFISANRRLAKLYRHEGKFGESIDISKKNVQKSIEIGDTACLIEALNDIATNYRRLGILDEASAFHHRALELCGRYSDKTSKRARKNRVRSLNGLGNVYLTLDNRNLADSVFRMALEGEKELGSFLGQAINYSNIGAIFENGGQVDSAMYYYNKSLECNRKCNSDVGIALCYTHFGKMYEKQGDIDAAVEQYRKAYDLMYNNIDRWHWLESCVALARVYSAKNDFKKTIEYNTLAEKAAIEMNSIEHLAQINLVFSEIYEKRGDYKKAMDYYRKCNEYSNKLLNDKGKNSIIEQRIDYINSSKEDQIDLLKRNYDNERKLRRVFVVSTILLLTAMAFIIILSIHLSRVRNRNRRQLAKAENARRTFFTNITHEFRTPLTVILGLSRRLNEGKLNADETTEGISSMIMRQGSNLLTLINQLLDISKVKSAVADPDWYRGNIVPYMQMLCDNHCYSLRQKHLELHFKSEKKNITVDFVPDYLRKVMNNLISNAIKFTPEYGKIYVTLSSEDKNIKIIVADTGKGIEENELKHIFDIYYQSNSNKSTLGSGVGLSLVNLIIRNIGGSIDVKSTPGKGTVFIITAPARSNIENIQFIDNNDDFNLIDDKEYNDGEIALPEGNTSDENEQIALIVEDNHDIAYYIGSELKKNYRLYYADNGRAGLEIAANIVPDIIITDLMMPEMDGYELCSQVRKSELLNHIPIIVITARSTEEDRIKGIEAGADAYLFKPFNSDELNARVENLLEMRNVLRRKYQQTEEQGIRECSAISDSDKKFLAIVAERTYSIMSEGNVSCETVSQKMNMTARQLNRKISAITGENASTYLMRVRLNKAVSMLDSQPDMMISEVAYKCGFEDNAYFSRIFKKFFDITPSQYRKTPKIK